MLFPDPLQIRRALANRLRRAQRRRGELRQLQRIVQPRLSGLLPLLPTTRLRGPSPLLLSALRQLVNMNIALLALHVPGLALRNSELHPVRRLPEFQLRELRVRRVRREHDRARKLRVDRLPGPRPLLFVLTERRRVSGAFGQNPSMALPRPLRHQFLFLFLEQLLLRPRVQVPDF